MRTAGMVKAFAVLGRGRDVAFHLAGRDVEEIYDGEGGRYGRDRGFQGRNSYGSGVI